MNIGLLSFIWPFEPPEKIAKIVIDPAVGMQPFQSRQLAFTLDLPNQAVGAASRAVMKCYRAFRDTDANLLEINPLVLTSDNQILAIDAKMTFDANALYRRPEIFEFRDKTQEDPRETNAAEHDLSYIGLEGNIGCIINGAGLAMATMDMIQHAGGEPANFLDIGGGASPERVATSIELVLSDQNVEAILINIFAGINRCDWVAQGIVDLLNKRDINIPLVVRLSGTNVEIYHFANKGICSWFQFAQEIATITKSECTLVPISSKDFNSKVKRPKYSLLNTEKVQQTFHIEILSWQDSLKQCLNKIN